MRKILLFKIIFISSNKMIVDVYAEKKRGRKRKLKVEPNVENDNTFNNFFTKREKQRIEKYGIIGYDLIVDMFNNIIKTKNIPNLTIFGKSGTGKSYIVNWLLSKLFKNNLKDRVLYLTLNDERGISTMRDKIKAFSNIQVKPDADMPLVKVIIFDQAEYLSMDAQNALRRIIELSNNITRFIFITRNTRAIIDPILSRCLQLHLNPKAVVDRISYYKKTFKKIEPDVIKDICYRYNNFGMEISIFEAISKYNGIENNERFEDDMEEIIKLLFNKDTQVSDFNYVINFLKSELILYLLHMIYKKIRDRIANDKLGSISSLFIEFEIQNNFNDMFILNLFSKIHQIIHS